MKSIKKVMAMCLAVIMMLSCIPAVYAADVANATIDPDAKGSLTLFKYDLTNAEKDGVWDSSYVSTGVYDENVNKTLGDAIRAGDTDKESDLGNDQVSYGYAVKGVEFTYLKVAEIGSSPSLSATALPTTMWKSCTASTRTSAPTC